MTAELDYAPGAPARRRRLVRRIGVGLALLIAALLAWRHVPTIWQCWRIQSITARASTFALPDSTVIYADDPSGFLLPYDIAGQRKTILFRLVDDANGRGAFVIPVNHPRPPHPRRQ